MGSDIDRPFNEKELASLAANPLVSIGNHTHNHAILTNYTRKEIRNELELSNKILKDLTGKFPETMAFPNGNYNEIALEESKAAGLKYVFTTERGSNHLPLQSNGDFYCLNRFMTAPINIKTFGGFCRLDYEPHAVFNNMKLKIKNLLIPNKSN